MECVNGVEGWQAASEEIPDLIISDVMMPEMDGFMLCQKLKTDERTSHIPVILLTAKSSQSDQVTGLDTGADIYLTKPFSTQVLELSVRNLLTAREKMRLKFSKEFVLQPQNVAINTVDEQFLTRLIGVIEEYMDDPEFSMDLLSTKMMMSQSVLYKKIRALTDMSANDFAKMIRLKRAAQLLQQGQYSVFDVSVMVGFNDRKYFSKEFKKQFGKTPSEFIQSDEVSE
jgi:YesN/AraC family two-component response regulator